MKKCLIPITLILSAVLMTGFFSCSSEEEINSYIGYLSEDSLEMICENVELATQVAGDAFVKCKSINDVKKYIDDIKKCESVEDVWIDNQTMFVKIKDFGTIPYVIKPEVDDMPDDFFEDLDQDVRTRVNSKDIIQHIQLDNKKVCVANQLIADERGVGEQSRKVTSLFEKMFSTCGYIGESGIQPDLEFFQNKIYNYDMIFIITHGTYDSKEDLHWLYTTVRCDEPTEEDEKKKENGITRARVHQTYGKMYASFRSQHVQIGALEERRKGHIGIYYYLMVSDKLISSSKNRFGEGKTPIIFNTACESLMGNDKLSDAFIGNGAKAYYGYDRSNNVGHKAGLEFFRNLMVGKSQLAAYNALPNDYRNNLYEFKTAHLLHKYAKDLDYEHSCIEHPTLTDVIDFSESDGAYVTLKATIRNYYSGVSSPIYGFYIGESDKPEEAEFDYTVKLREDEGCYMQSHTAYFEKKIPAKDLKSETTYHCWAYISDKESFCFSNMGTFTTPEKTIDQVIPDEIRKTMEPYITIYDGDNPPNVEGTYLIEPMEIVYDATGNYQSGYNKFKKIYFRISNQNTAKNTLDYHEKEVSGGIEYGEAKGDGAFISGDGDNFSLYFNTVGVTHLEKYDVQSKDALVISGTKTSSGIKNLCYSFIMIEKSADPDNNLMDAGDFRVFKDGDGNAKNASWPSLVRSQQITVRDGKVITPWSRHSVRAH